MIKRAGRVSNALELGKKNRYAQRTIGSQSVIVSAIKYRQGDFKNVGKIAEAVAELKDAGFEIEAINTTHANGLFRSFFLTNIVAVKTA